MKPITDPNSFSNIDSKDLLETQRQITLLIKKISTSRPEDLKVLEKDLYYWTNRIFYEKAKFLLKDRDKIIQKVNKIKTIIE